VSARVQLAIHGVSTTAGGIRAGGSGTWRIRCHRERTNPSQRLKESAIRHIVVMSALFGPLSGGIGRKWTPSRSTA